MSTQATRPRPTRQRQPRRRRRRKKFPLVPVLAVSLAAIVVICTVISHVAGGQLGKLARDQQIIEINGAGRRGEKLEAVNDIVIHYVGNPGTTAQQNHDFYDQPTTTVSSHFLIGLDGEIIQCIPLDEKSSASNDRNIDTLSIEVCHPDETGKFNQASYDSLVKLTAWLCETFHLNPESDVIRHYDVTGKYCPRYYVENEDAWAALRSDVSDRIAQDQAAAS